VKTLLLSVSAAVCLVVCRTTVSTPVKPEKPPASSIPEKLEKRLLGKQILFFDGTVKEGDPTDPTTQSAGTTYINCRDTYTYFVEPIPDEERHGPISGINGPLKHRKVFHGLRIVYDEKGHVHRIENYYAGVPHGQTVWFHDDGTRWCEINYQFGLRHGISRDYRRDGKLLQEHEFIKEKQVSTRSYHDNGQPDRWIVADTILDEFDREGKPIPKK
jgi:hypothetical protein